MDHMKYAVILCDGMADTPVPQLNDKTPMAVANKPCMNHLASLGTVGTVKTVPDGYPAGSDVANLSVLGYAPEQYYAGRSPLEAASIGISLKPTDIAMRCNLVTLSDEPDYKDKTMVDYCADDISTEEAAELIAFLAEHFNNDTFALYAGVSYRHCLVWDNGTDDLDPLTPPHDISDRKITDYLPTNPNAAPLLEMTKRSYELLPSHPVNQKRIARGQRPANSVWFWGCGRYKALSLFQEKFGVSGAIISAVDLIKGIGKLAEMDVIEVEGATGYIDTNFAGKAQAAIKALKKNDFVYLHVEAPDECGHRGEIENKVKSIEIIDRDVLTPVLTALEQSGEPFKILVLPDHPTPLAIKTHTREPVPYLLYSSTSPEKNSCTCWEEESAKDGPFYSSGPALMEAFLK